MRLIGPALADLKRIRHKNDPQIVRILLKKLLLTQRNPEAGAPLCGALADFRKIIVGDRAWRVIWCLTHEDTDEAVYTEMTERVEALRKNPRTVSLAKTIEELGKIAFEIASGSGISAGEEATADWLRRR